jgi:hypothetical protein
MCDRVTLNVSGAWALALATSRVPGGASKASKGGAGSGSDYQPPAPRAGVNLYLQVDKTRLAGPHETTNV